MIPATINWNVKRTHVALERMPRHQVHRTVMRWIIGIVAAQWVVGLLLLTLMAEPWRGQVRAGLQGQTTLADTGRLLLPVVCTSAIAALGVGLLGLFGFGLWVHRWNRGLGTLYAAFRHMGKVDDLQPVPFAGNAEADFLIAAYNDMAGRLSASQRQLLGLNENLKEQVSERTDQWRRASELAEQANHAKSAFLATMSHEIRTPLTGVIGSLEALRRLDRTPAQDRLLQAGWTSSHALLNLINDILDISAIEAGKIQLAERPMNLQAMIDEVFAIVGPAAEDKNLTLRSDVAPTVRGEVLGDPARLRQVLLNLVNNAIKFTDRGGVTVSVEPTSPGETELQFTVRDSGVGISEEGMQTLFGRFARTDNDMNVLRGGTGLGLNICRQLVQRMGGAIHVSSHPGEGSSFWFSIPLPLAPHPEQAAGALTTSPLVEPRTVSVTVERGRSNARVLLAEDNPVNRYLISQLLEEMGASVTAVADGRSAVRAFEDSGYDLIFMDVRMPVLDGHAATRRIRDLEAADAKKQGVTIVALTANVMDDEVAACLDAGMDRYLAKPVDHLELRGELERAVQASETPGPPSLADQPSEACPAPVPPINLHDLEQVCSGHPERLGKLLRVIDEQFQRFQSDLDQCLNQTPEPDVTYLAHAITGCALQARADELAETARSLEHAPNTNRMQKIDALKKNLADCLRYLADATHSELAPGAVPHSPSDRMIRPPREAS